MRKNQFRLLILASLAIDLLSVVYDYVWPNPVTEKVYDYIVEIEPEIEGVHLIILGAVGLVVLVMALVSVVGLLLFKAMG